MRLSRDCLEFYRGKILADSVTYILLVSVRGPGLFIHFLICSVLLHKCQNCALLDADTVPYAVFLNLHDFYYLWSDLLTAKLYTTQINTTLHTYLHKESVIQGKQH